MKKLIKTIQHANQGMTLLEILISVTILAAVVLPLLGLFTAAFRNTSISQQTTEGVYSAQAVIEEIRVQSYKEILAIPSGYQSYDSNGDGTADVYKQVITYPAGVHEDIAGHSTVNYIHIVYEGNSVLVLGSDGTSTWDNGVAEAVPAGNMQLQISGDACILTVSGTGGQRTINFTKRFSTAPVVVIVNMNNKTYGTTHTLDITGGSVASVHVVQYATAVNQQELQSASLMEENQYIGINNYNTSLIHVAVSISTDGTQEGQIASTENLIEVQHLQAGGS